MRTTTLVRMLDGGETSLAWTLFDRLLVRGFASGYHLTTMLKACLTSEEQRALVLQGEEKGLVPDIIAASMMLG